MLAFNSVESDFSSSHTSNDCVGTWDFLGTQALSEVTTNNPFAHLSYKELHKDIYYPPTLEQLHQRLLWVETTVLGWQLEGHHPSEPNSGHNDGDHHQATSPVNSTQNSPVMKTTEIGPFKRFSFSDSSRRLGPKAFQKQLSLKSLFCSTHQLWLRKPRINVREALEHGGVTTPRSAVVTHKCGAEGRGLGGLLIWPPLNIFISGPHKSSQDLKSPQDLESDGKIMQDLALPQEHCCPNLRTLCCLKTSRSRPQLAQRYPQFQSGTPIANLCLQDVQFHMVYNNMMVSLLKYKSETRASRLVSWSFKGYTVKAVLTHTPRWTAKGMGYYSIWVSGEAQK
ncbi:hypothetical protein B0H13DRAFT_1863930 [Mycena leptocephala]|nr:hypothetical protein B0H13DRAFT_1863930 [Mycena leptocephala]